MLDPTEYQPKVVLRKLDPSSDEESDEESDMEIELDSPTKDPDYRPGTDVPRIPNLQLRRSSRIEANKTYPDVCQTTDIEHYDNMGYSPTDSMAVQVSDSDTDSEIAVTISDPPSPVYVIDSDSFDEFEDSPQPKQIPVVISSPPAKLIQSRTPSPFPFPLKLNKVALYPRNFEEPYLLELSHYPKLRSWHSQSCKCKIPDPKQECLAEFYQSYGACPITQATNFLNESPKLIIENNNVELFKYYTAHDELEKFVEAIHYLPRGIADLQSGFAMCKMVDSYLILIHLDALCHHTKIGIYATLPIDFRPNDTTMINRCTATYLFIEKELYNAIRKVKQNLPYYLPDMERWVSTNEIDYNIDCIRLPS